MGNWDPQKRGQHLEEGTYRVPGGPRRVSRSYNLSRLAVCVTVEV
jgi:hypothetical protein